MRPPHVLPITAIAVALCATLGCGDDSPDNPHATNNGATNNGATNNATNNGTPVNDVNGPWSYLLVDDYTPVTEDNRDPGADIDAIGLIKASDGSTAWVVKVPESNVAKVGNDHLEVSEVIGAPDAGCDKRHYVAVGGADAVNFLVVRFGTEVGDVTVESGDQVAVEEVGPLNCPDGGFDDEQVELALSVSNSRQTWIALGTWHPGEDPVTVP